MNSFINRLQKDLHKLQTSIQKEGNDLLEKLRNLDLKENLEQKRKELEKVMDSKLGKIEPVYSKFIAEVRKNAKKAGIDITKLEKQLKKGATVASQTIKTATSRVNKKTGKATKKKTSGSAGKTASTKTATGAAPKKRKSKKTSSHSEA